MCVYGAMGCWGISSVSRLETGGLVMAGGGFMFLSYFKQTAGEGVLLCLSSFVFASSHRLLGYCTAVELCLICGYCTATARYLFVWLLHACVLVDSLGVEGLE